MEVVIVLQGMLILLVAGLWWKSRQANASTIQEEHLERRMRLLEQKLEDLFRASREESSTRDGAFRAELSRSFETFRQSMGDESQRQAALQREAIDRSFLAMLDLQKERFAQLDRQQQSLIGSTEKRLDQMRETVEEKLQKTLNERLSHSFETVGNQLKAVQEGLGEMKTIAQDVGGLKKVLSQVKQRGILGEIQLSMLLESILAPEQYAAEVKTKRNSQERVEFAIKLPGRGEGQAEVWLPIDAKFPGEVFATLQAGYETGDTATIEEAGKQLEATLRKMARDIRDKYLDPPYTTDFALLFLPFEGLYAEVVRRSALLEQLQREYKVVITGPSTLAALLNSLQMGFRTLALQKRSAEVWAVLSGVKTEFEKFGGLLEKAHKNLNTAGSAIEELMGTRTRAIQRQLREVERLPEADAGSEMPPSLI